MSINPAKTRAVAPVSRLPVLLNFGSTEDVLFDDTTLRLGALRAALLATSCLKVFRDVKYKAEPKPVRNAEGTVPRHRDVMGCGRERMERRTGSSDEERDCWTRVLSKSAGCRRTAEETPDARPARKWKVGWEDLRFGTSLELPWDISEPVSVRAQGGEGVADNCESPWPSFCSTFQPLCTERMQALRDSECEHEPVTWLREENGIIAEALMKSWQLQLLYEAPPIGY